MEPLNAASEALRSQLRQALANQLSILPDKSEETVDNTLAALWHAAAGNPMSETLASSTPLGNLDEAHVEKLKLLVERRLAGVPLAHLSRRKRFLDLEYVVNEGIYIPRIETELLGRTALGLLSERFADRSEVLVMDLCTGIGTLALAVAHHQSNVRAHASDLLPESIANANANAAHFGLVDRASFYCGDMFKPYESAGLQGRVSVVLSAPPYISAGKVKTLPSEIANHEPEAAFNAGPFGMSIFSELIASSPNYLHAGGYLAMEVGLGQGKFLKERILKNGSYQQVQEVNDEHGNVRVLVAQLK